jgi:hypothetical protein
MSFDEQWYLGREQTLVKHTILQRYFLRLAVIVGTWADAISRNKYEEEIDGLSETNVYHVPNDFASSERTRSGI